VPSDVGEKRRSAWVDAEANDVAEENVYVETVKKSAVAVASAKANVNELNSEQSSTYPQPSISAPVSGEDDDTVRLWVVATVLELRVVFVHKVVAKLALSTSIVTASARASLTEMNDATAKARHSANRLFTRSPSEN